MKKIIALLLAVLMVLSLSLIHICLTARRARPKVGLIIGVKS